MDLFIKESVAPNLLPVDGEVNYINTFLSHSQADTLFDSLLTSIAWSHDEIVMFGRKIITSREVAWYGDSGLNYRYSGVTKQPLPWTSDLINLKQLIEEVSGDTFNSCLLNLYHSGREGMGWHSDDEKELKYDGTIASVSLGAPRRFVFKHRTESLPKPEILLEHGSLLLMKGSTQRHWWHRLPPSSKVSKSRINLTFRTINR
jgi:alkylated DNA repair dioxygenase AlkB